MCACKSLRQGRTSSSSGPIDLPERHLAWLDWQNYVNGVVVVRVVLLDTCGADRPLSARVLAVFGIWAPRGPVSSSRASGVMGCDEAAISRDRLNIQAIRPYRLLRVLPTMGEWGAGSAPIASTPTLQRCVRRPDDPHPAAFGWTPDRLVPRKETSARPGSPDGRSCEVGAPPGSSGSDTSRGWLPRWWASRARVRLVR